MKHYSGIDYDHFLDNVRDMYPFSVLEAILTELIANALDAKTSLIDLRVDPENRILEIVDNGSAMDKRGFEMYHNFSTSFKRKGHGIGFAGLGAKLALKVSDSVVTETRQTEGTPGRRGRTLVPQITIVRSRWPEFPQILDGLPTFPSRWRGVLRSWRPRAGRCRSNGTAGQTCG